MFQILTGVLAVYAERNWKDKNAFSHNYDSLIGDILARKLTKREDIAERANYLGLSASGEFVLLKLTVASGMEPVLGRIGRELLDRFPDAQVVLHEAAVLALFRLRLGNRGTDWLRGPVEELLVRHQARGGLSNQFSGLEDLPLAYSQASLALKYSTQMKGRDLLESLMPEPEEPNLYAYQERMLHILLGEYEGNEDIWKSSVYYTALKTLHDYDLQHSSNNLQLLRVYLWYERKITETGQRLHMHRNSVIYRISRMENMIGLDLDDYRTRLALQMSFLLLELYGFPPEEARQEEQT